MLESLRSKKKIIMAIEIIGLVIFAAVLLFRMKNPQIIEVKMEDMITDYGEAISFDGEKWTISDEIGASYQGSDFIIYSPDVKLSKGSYTLMMDYTTNDTQRFTVESNAYGDIVFNGDTEFFLSRNKNSVSYDFELINSIDDFRVRLNDYTGNYFSISGLRIIRNTHDIRQCLFLWIVVSIILNIILFNEKFANNRNLIFAVVGIGLVASLPLFVKGIIMGHDLQFHLVRIDAIAEGIRDGYFPTKMYTIFNDGYGYPSGVYYGDMLLYIPAIFRVIGFSVTASYKLYVLILNFAIAALAYVCGKCLFRKDNIALIFSLVYSLSTYRMVCAYVRQSIAEYAASGFYLIIILAIWNIYVQDTKEKKYMNNSVLLAAGMSGLIYTHVLSTQLTVIVLLIVALVLYKYTFELRRLLCMLYAAGICILLSMAFIVPFLEYYSGVTTMFSDRDAASYIQDKGAYISDYLAFFKSVTGGATTNVGERMSYTPGLVLILAFIYAMYLIVKKQAPKKIKAMTLGSGLLLFVASNMFPWNLIYKIPVIGNFMVQVQFPFRYIGIAVCFLSILCCMVIDYAFDKETLPVHPFVGGAFMLLCTMGLFLSSLESGATQIYPVDTASLRLYTDSSEYGNGGTEYLIDDTVLEGAEFDYTVNGENVEAAIQGESGLCMDVYVKAEKGAYVDVPRFNYPYFKATDADGNELSISSGINNKIRINFSKAYEGIVRVDFVEPLHWRIAELISLLSVVGVIVLVAINRKKSLCQEQNNVE